MPGPMAIVVQSPENLTVTCRMPGCDFVPVHVTDHDEADRIADQHMDEAHPEIED